MKVKPSKDGHLFTNYPLTCKLKGQAQPVVVVTVVGVVVVTIGNATVLRIVVPATTTKHAIRALYDTALHF